MSKVIHLYSYSTPLVVSIISPVYNVAPYIGECIQSLKAQTFTDFEVLFVDDHGMDDSIQVARKAVGEDPRFKVLSTPSNAGPGVARNVGIEAAQGELIAFIDSDDLWKPDFLALMVAKANSHINGEGKPLDLTYCQLTYQGGTKDGLVHRNPVLEPGMFTPAKKRSFLQHFVTFSVCFLFRRAFLEENNLKFPGLTNSEDTHFLIRCLLLAKTIGCVDTPLYVYCVRESSLSTGHNRNKYKQRLSAMRSLKESYQSLCNDEKYRDLALRQYRGVMQLIYFKKGYAQAILDIWHNFL